MSKAPRPSAVAIWQAVLPAAEQLLGAEVAQNWLKQLEPIDILGPEFYLSAPTAMHRDWVTNRYADDLLRIMRRHEPDLKQVCIRVSTAAQAVVTPSFIQDRKNISFVHAGLCQVFLPRQKTDERIHDRTSGNASLRIKAGEVWHNGKWEEVPLPYGGKARSLMSEIQSQVAKTGSATIDLDRSMRAFAENHSIDTNGRNLKMLANQAVYLGSANILLGYRDPKTRADVTLGGKVAKQISIWSVEGNQPALWPNTLELSTDFRDAILEHHVPIRNTAMHALDHNALAQDFYVFLAYRLHVIDPARPAQIPWAVLHQQFEGVKFDPQGRPIRPENINSYYPWRKRAIQAIDQVLPHYPDAKVETTRDHLILRHSKPPVSKIVTASIGRP
jgi:hypothetical protein